jgi:hypothetical protein
MALISAYIHFILLLLLPLLYSLCKMVLSTNGREREREREEEEKSV